jgi:Alpha/beta hydrolase domain
VGFWRALPRSSNALSAQHTGCFFARGRITSVTRPSFEILANSIESLGPFKRHFVLILRLRRLQILEDREHRELELTMPTKSRPLTSYRQAIKAITLIVTAPGLLFGGQSNGYDSAKPGSVSKMAVPNPTITGPISGGDHGVAFGAVPTGDLERAGYLEREYFYGGTARAFGNDGPWGVDGVWATKIAGTADYKVRMLVRRPADARRFNGTLLLSWRERPTSFKCRKSCCAMAMLGSGWVCRQLE